MAAKRDRDAVAAQLVAEPRGVGEVGGGIGGIEAALPAHQRPVVAASLIRDGDEHHGETRSPGRLAVHRSERLLRLIPAKVGAPVQVVELPYGGVPMRDHLAVAGEGDSIGLVEIERPGHRKHLVPP